MKLRCGFVSNSSSSSFTCDICNSTESGWDMGISEAGMRSCVEGHVFCVEHMDPLWEPSLEEKRDCLLSSWKVRSNKRIRAWLESVSTEAELKEVCDEHGLRIDFDNYDLPAAACPICSFGKVYERDLLKYLLKTIGRTEGDLLRELKSKFDSYNSLRKWLSEE